MWMGVHHGFWMFPFIFFPIGFFVFIILVFILLRVFFFRRFGGGCFGPYSRDWQGSFDAENILKRRLASGEITEEQYKQLKAALKQ